MDNDKKAPEIRFDGFVEPWEQHDLTDVLSPTIGNNTLSRAELNYDDGEVKCIHYGDVLIKFGSFVDAVNDEIPFITNGTIADFKSYLLQDGDVIFADTAEDETVGKVVEVTNAKDKNIVSGLHTIVYRPKQIFADCFMGYYLNTNAYRHQLLPLMQGVKVLSLGRSHLATTFVRYPSELDEQATIAAFFNNVDETIALKKRLYEQIVNIKKAMLEKMFPKKGTDVPEIRFKGFEGAWEQWKMEDALKIRNETVNPDNYDFDVELENIVSDRGTLMGDTSIRTQTKSLFRKGDTLFGRLRPYLNKWWFADRDGLKSGEIWALVPLGAFVDTFAYMLVQSDTFLSHANISSGTKMPRADWSKVSDAIILTPSPAEQVLIGNFFRNLDSLISTQLEELEKLQNIKTACLSKMFV